MKPLFSEKRIVAALVPYVKNGDQVSYYLQKRDRDAKTNPDKFGLFGGGLEGTESPEEALVREIEEELVYTTKNPIYFSRYENRNRIYHVYLEEVDDSFASKVTVREGQYGTFLSHEEILAENDMGPVTRLVLAEVHAYLAEKRV